MACTPGFRMLKANVNQTRKEIATRYDFKGSQASIKLDDEGLTIIGDDDYRLNAVNEILRARLVRRKLDPKCLEYGSVEAAGGGNRRQHITVKQGLGQDLAKKIVKTVKQEKKKVQIAIQGDQIRVSGKKRDDLQAVITLIRAMDADRPLKFTNFRG